MPRLVPRRPPVLPLALAMLLAMAACSTVSPAPAPTPRPGVDEAASPAPIDTLALREHTRVLAHDSLLGRGTGSAGAHGAARYIARTLRTLGLQTLGGRVPDSAQAYFDPVPLIRADVSAATLSTGDRVRRNGDGFVVGRIGREGLHAAAGPVDRLGADSTNVRAGSWLLLDASLGEAAARWLPVWRERGIAGVLIRLGSDPAVAGWNAQLGPVRWQLAEGPPDAIWQPALPVLMIAPTLADGLAAGSARVAFDPGPHLDTVADFNVVGVLPGGTPEAAPVFLTAHYDHLGTRRGIGADSIFNGFSDNAAGVAMLLAIAQSARAAPPERPLVFLFTTGEEVGLLGSIDFVRTHSELVERAHALVNLDAGAPPAPPTRWRLAAGTRSAAGAVAADVVAGHGWAHRSDPGSPNSDHWPFVVAGVPSVFLIPDGAFEGVDEAAARLLVQRWDRYHRPDDEWAADFPFSGLARYALLAREIVYALADAELDR